jgi:hypothetical protein
MGLIDRVPKIHHSGFGLLAHDPGPAGKSKPIPSCPKRYCAGYGDLVCRMNSVQGQPKLAAAGP